jgi:hypothetical protein
MPIETIFSCPLGSECKTVKDGKIHQCLWLTGITQVNKQTGETEAKELCAIAWLPILNVEAAMTNRGQTDAICSLRDETLKRQDMAIQAMVEFKDHRDVRIIKN